jgi:hypothetical protein
MEHNSGGVVVKLPFGLKLVAVITIIEGGGVLGAQFIGFYTDWLVAVLGAMGIAAGIGLLLRRKWAWLLAVAITALGIIFSLIILAFLRQFYNVVLLKLDASYRVGYLFFTVAGYVYLGFCAYYLTRSRIRALFGIGSKLPD